MTSPTLRRPTVRRLAVLVAWGVALLGAASCGVSRESSQPAATITFSDGTRVEIGSEYAEVVSAIAGHDGFLELIFGSAADEQVASGQLDTAVLTQFVGAEIMDHLAGAVGAEIDDAARTDAAAAAELDLATALANGGLGVDTDGLQPYFALAGRFESARVALQGALAQDVPCVSHILVDTEDEADDLLAELDAGGDFAALATEHSTDPGSGAAGGDLGCVSVDQWVPEFRDAVIAAPENEVVGPVQSQFGYHLILVTGYEPGTGESEASAAVQAEVQAMTVEVDPAIGSWAGGQVVPAVSN